MSVLWADVAGQPAAVRFLRNALASERIPTLLLFAGPRGVGKRTVARVFAGAALCEAPADTVGPSAREEPCGRCGSCREFAAGVNPDFILPRYMVKEGKSSESRLLADEDRLIGLRRTVRPLLEDVRLRPARGGRRLVLIRRADRMNEESQNALLKSLEEPAGGLSWILTSDDPAGLLETVRSRATRLRFGRVPGDVLAERLTRGLAGGPPIPGDDALEVARASEGSFARALEMLSEGWQDERGFVDSEVVPHLHAGPAGGPLLARKLVERANSGSRGGVSSGVGKLEAARRSALRLLEVLASALRDRLREAVGAGGGDWAIWAGGLKVVLDSEAAVRQNVRVELALTATAVRLARARPTGA